MKRDERRPVTAEVEGVRQRIEHWRRTRRKRTAMPEELWAAAVGLAEKHSVYRIARALRLDYSTLKLRVVQAELTDNNEATPLVSFVEFEPDQLMGGGEHSGGVAELSAADGARMTIRWAEQQMDVVGLAEAFWRRGA